MPLDFIKELLFEKILKVCLWWESAKFHFGWILFLRVCLRMPFHGLGSTRYMCRQLFPESDKPVAVSDNITGSQNSKECSWLFKAWWVISLPCCSSVTFLKKAIAAAWPWSFSGQGTFVIHYRLIGSFLPCCFSFCLVICWMRAQSINQFG